MFYIGQILLLPYGFAPSGWILCDGSSLPIQQYIALYSLIGTNFGGDGSSTFNVPDLRSQAVTSSNGVKIYYYICLNGLFPPRN